MFCINRTITEPYRKVTEPFLCTTDGSVYTEPSAGSTASAWCPPWLSPQGSAAPPGTTAMLKFSFQIKLFWFGLQQHRSVLRLKKSMVSQCKWSLLTKLIVTKLSSQFFSSWGRAQWRNSRGQAVITSWDISVGTFRRFKGPGGNQVSNVVLRGAKELPWPRRFQICVTLDALHVIGCYRFKKKIFFFLHFSIKKKIIMKNVHSKSPHQKLCNSPTMQIGFFLFFNGQKFFVHLKKNCVLQFFLLQKWTKKFGN